MTESKTLLSQNEIDTLISFLQNHDEAPIGSVLDQGSIDKLVEIIKFNNTKGIYFGKDTSLDISASEENAIIKDSDGTAIVTDKYHIDFEKDSSGYVNIFCEDTKAGTRFILSPSCLSKKAYILDDEQWGLAVSPRILVRLSRLFNITCDASVLLKAEKDFAKLVYGDENARIADYYLAN